MFIMHLYKLIKSYSLLSIIYYFSTSEAKKGEGD